MLPKTKMEPSTRFLGLEFDVIRWPSTPGDKNLRTGPLYKVMIIAPPTEITVPITFARPPKLLILTCSSLRNVAIANVSIGNRFCAAEPKVEVV